MAGARVTFYVLADADESARRSYACRLIEKAYLQHHQVLVRLGSPDDVREFDDLLWRFSDRSFVPHEVCPPARAGDAPVLLTAEAEPPAAAGVLVNLGRDVPAWYGRFERVAELVGADEDSRRAGRERFRFYREQGLEPETHNLGAS
ncbi:MAG: polymerase subunit chi [Proteobacteria bacterium]|nr:polymerase subunit chi [Pseudomonadota bacterium]